MIAVPYKEALGWDVMNWSACLDVWEPHVSTGPLNCLEIGCGPGGLSLWLASKGHSVVCSDVTLPSSEVHDLHRRYGVAERIAYAAIDCTDIGAFEKFDIIAVKSVLGGVLAHCGVDAFHRSILGMHNALKPNGKILFAENLRATSLHEFSRRHLLRRTPAHWVYPSIDEMVQSFSDYSKLEYTVTGLLGCFGRAEWQRRLLAAVDRVMVPLVPQRWRYIMAGVALK